MKIKQHLLTWGFGLLAVAASPVLAAQVYDSFDQASKAVKDTGYIVWMYPAGWDRYSEKLCRQLAADAAVQAAAGDAVMLLAPIYQNNTEETKALAKKMMGNLNRPDDMSDISYPAILFYEKDQRKYATICGEPLTKANNQQVAELIANTLAAKKKQDKLMSKAERTKDGEEKACLILESSHVPGIEWPAGLRGKLQQADPQGQYGCMAALNFGFGPKDGESLESLSKRLDEVLDNPKLTANQKQRACAAAIGHVRRSEGTLAGGPFITKYGRLMQKLDPTSPLGLSATVVMRDWVTTFRYGQGWSPEVIPGSATPVRMQDVPITTPGTYNVTFKIVTGRDPLYVKKLRLMDGTRCVASDPNGRDITWGQTSQTFTLNVKKAVKKPVLEMTFGNTAANRSTWGNISIEKK